MADQTIASEQDVFQQWYDEWLNTNAERTPESMLAYFKARLCAVFGAQA